MIRLDAERRAAVQTKECIVAEQAPEASQESLVALSFVRGDPERRLGLPAGSYTHPNHFVALVMAIVLTVGFFAIMARMGDNVIGRSFTERGPVPYPIVLFSLWGAVILLVKWMKLRFQRRALTLKVVPPDPSFSVSPATAEWLLDRLHEVSDDPRRLVLFNRVQMALANLKNMRQVGDVRHTLDSQSEADEAVMESGYSIVKGLIWAIPVLGFIGTVLGLSVAIGSFGEVLSSSSDVAQLKPALQRVTAGLAVAFETTLQGLLAALVLQLGLTVVKRTEEQFLDSCKEYCQRQIVSRLRLADGETA